MSKPFSFVENGKIRVKVGDLSFEVLMPIKPEQLTIAAQITVENLAGVTVDEIVSDVYRTYFNLKSRENK